MGYDSCSYLLFVVIATLFHYSLIREHLMASGELFCISMMNDDDDGKWVMGEEMDEDIQECWQKK